MIKYNKHKNANFQSPVTILSEKGSFDPLLTLGAPQNESSFEIRHKWMSPSDFSCDFT